MRRKRRLYLVLAFAAGMLWACSSSGYDDEYFSSAGGDSGAAGGFSGSANAGQRAEAGASGRGSGATGQVAGQGSVQAGSDGTAPARLDGGLFSEPFVDCVALTETARNTRGPADVVIAIDNTPSMYNEIEEVRANMNRLSQRVEQEGLDLHIVLISCFTEQCLRQRNWHTICIDPPVGAEGACSETGNLDDSKPPSFLHVDESVESRKAFQNVIDTLSVWGAAIRDNAAKHVVVVSDDGDEWTAEQFTTALIERDPRFEDYQFHGIFAYLSKEAACATSSSEPCCTYAAPDGEGTAYKELVQARGGVSGDLCLQDFDPVFDQLAGQVIASAALSCEWVIPDPPQGRMLDARLVNVEYKDGSGEQFLIGRVSDSGDCERAQQAWYYDNADNPTMIRVCAQTCDWIQGQVGSEMNIQFGCESVWAPIE